MYFNDAMPVQVHRLEFELIIAIIYYCAYAAQSVTEV